MRQDEYQRYDAVGLAELVRSRDVSPTELLDTALARVAEVNPALNAVIMTLGQNARNAIHEGLPNGPFRGVPFLLKDVTTRLAGAATTSGSRVFLDNVAPIDSALVADYKRAGFVIFGKTNTPEFALTGVTEPDLYGTTLNPWNSKVTCGGSSGGAAAAVASGIVPAAQASDGGGSIRIPAACCGLFGLKPSRGRVSMSPIGEGWGGLTTLHAITRSVRDSAAILDASCRVEAGDPYWLGAPTTPYAQEVKREPGKLAIGMVTCNLYGRPLTPPCASALVDAAKLCESLGHSVQEIAPPPGLEGMTDLMMALAGTAVAVTLENEVTRRGRPISEGEIEPLTRLVYERAKTISATQYVQAVQAMHAIGRRTVEWMGKFDVMLTTTLGMMPIPVGTVKEFLTDLSALVAKLHDFGPNTPLFNVSGQPAMSVPLTWSDDGIPIGIQFVGRPADEATLFRLAAQLERARPWFDRRPPHPFG